jgi:CHAT domain-containing protein/tetratricopeptide (TPR) repeat protein
MNIPHDRLIYPGRWAAQALLLVVGFAHVALGSPQGPGAAPAPTQAAASPPTPAPKALSEADAKRVNELSQASGAMWREGKFGEALEPARKAFAICEKALGADHWQTAEWTRFVKTLRGAVELPAEGREALASVTALDDAAEAAYTKAQYEEAANLLRRCLEVKKRWLGERHPDTATSYNKVASLLKDRGDLPGAEAMHRKALAIYREVLGERHPYTAMSYRNLAAVLHARRDLPGAEAMFRKALAINLETLGERHPYTVLSYNNLANVLYDRRDLPGAEAMHRKVLSINLATLGERHPETAESYKELGQTLLDQNKHSEAEAMYRKAFEIIRRTNGEEDPETIRCSMNLARVLLRERKYSEAEPMIRRALVFYRRTLGEDSGFTGYVYGLLGEALCYQPGRGAEAEVMARKELDIRRRILGEDQLLTAHCYCSLASCVQVQGRATEAEPLFRRALEIARKDDDGGADVASFSICLGLNLDEQGKFAEAEGLCRKALTIYRRTLGDGHERTAFAYSCLAGNLEGQEKYHDAEPLRQRELEILKASLGEEAAGTAESLEKLAQNLDAQGKCDEAERLCRRALDVHRKALGEDNRATAASMEHLGSIISSQGRYEEAEPLLSRSLEIRRKVLGEDNEEVAGGLAALATNLQRRGRADEAEPLFRKSLEILRRARGADKPVTAEATNNLAANLLSQGKVAEGGVMSSMALAAYRRARGEDHPSTAASLSVLATTLTAQGKEAEAEVLLRQALNILLRAEGADHPKTARAYNNLAVNLAVQGKFAEAGPLAEKAWIASQRGLNVGDAEAAGLNMATIVLSTLQRRHAQAEQRLREALTVSLRVLGEDHRQVALIDVLLALSLQGQGRYAEAEPFRRRAKSISRRAPGGVDHITMMCDMLEAADFYVHRHYSDAEQSFLRVARSFEACRQASGYTGLERAMATAKGSPFVYLCILSAVRGEVAGAWTWLETDLARGLHEDLARPLDVDERHREQSLLSRLHGADERLAILIPRASRVEVDRRRIDSIRQERDRIQVELSEFEASVYRKYGAAAGRPYDLVRIQAHIPLDAALLAWADPESSNSLPDGLPAETRWACLVRRSGGPVWIKMPGSSPGGTWSRDDETLPELVLSALSLRPDGTSDSWEGLVRRLAAQRLLPLVPNLGPRDGLPAVRHLIVLPSRSMKGVPVEALVQAVAGMDRRCTISYAPSGTIFAWLREHDHQSRRDRRGMRRLLALGDPTFAPRVGVTNSRSMDGAAEAASKGEALSALPGTRREVKAIAALFEDPEVLLGSEASEQRLDELARADGLRRFDVIHMATHGRMIADLWMQSRLFLARDRLPDLTVPAAEGRELYDGELTADQILRTWNLDADLVVLSACESGLGRDAGSEGYLGFAQALFLKGARSLVLSQWKVDDKATSLLMARFYQNLLGKRPGLSNPMPKALALQEAKEWLRNLAQAEVDSELATLDRGPERPLVNPNGPANSAATPTSKPAGARPYAHPYYWAAFILIGDPG